MNIFLKEFEPKYLENCLAIFRSCQEKYFADEEINEFNNFLSQLSKQLNGEFYVLEINRNIVGCGGFYVKENPSTAGLCWEE